MKYHASRLVQFSPVCIEVEYATDANGSMSMYDQPTESQPQQDKDSGGGLQVEGTQPGQAIPGTSASAATVTGASKVGNLSRRTFMGKSLAAMAAIGGAGITAGVGGAALE